MCGNFWGLWEPEQARMELAGQHMLRFQTSYLKLEQVACLNRRGPLAAG